MLSSRNSVGELCLDQIKQVPDMGSLWRVTSYVMLLGLLTSCYMVSYEIVIVEPDHPSIAPPRAEQPLRLVAGLSGTEEFSMTEEIFKNEGISPGEFYELKALFAQQLRGLSLFQEVLYPVVPNTQPDLSIQVLLQFKLKPDWTVVPKLILTGLLLGLTAPLFDVEHHFVARGNVAIIHRDHIVKKYTANSDVITRMGIYANPPPMFWRQAASRARDSMMADLLHQLAQDRGLLSQFEPSL